VGKVYDRLDVRMEQWIGRQPMFFVATAPAEGGHVNLSPKGLDETFTVIDPRTVAYLDTGGSGAETIAHLRDDGRITIMFCSFEGPARIVRLYGRGEIHYPGDPGFSTLAERFGEYSARNIITVAVDRIADSCGFGVPEMTLAGQRTKLADWVAARSPEELAQFRLENNRFSIDGLPAIDPPRA
jgi:hypothetical protein